MSKISQNESNILQQNLWLWTNNPSPSHVSATETLGTVAQKKLDPSNGPFQMINPRWDNICDSFYKGINFTFTLNPDPKIDNFDNVKIMTTKLISNLYNNDTIQKVLFVHEHGKAGKFHYHGLFQSSDRDAFTKSILGDFNISTRVAHRTLVTKRCPDITYRNQYIKYMKKDTPSRAHYIYSKNKSPFTS